MYRLVVTDHQGEQTTTWLPQRRKAFQTMRKAVKGGTAVWALLCDPITNEMWGFGWLPAQRLLHAIFNEPTTPGRPTQYYFDRGLNEWRSY